MTPTLVIVAIDVLLLDHVPPVVGDKVCFSFTQISLFVGKLVIVGSAFIITVFVFLLHPVAELVNVKVTAPGAIAFITPAFVTVANALLLLVQVPPEDGVRFPLLPIHNLVGAVTIGVGLTTTVIVLLRFGLGQTESLDCIST